MTRAIILLAALAARECSLPAGTSLPGEAQPPPACPGLDCKVADHGCVCPEGTHYSCDFSPDTWTGRATCVSDEPACGIGLTGEPCNGAADCASCLCEPSADGPLCL